MLYYNTISTPTLELLKVLQEIPALKSTRLVGGTGLALQIGHRISVDIDLFANNLKEDFISIIAAIKQKGYIVDIRKQSSNIMVSMINGIKVDIVNYPYKWLYPPKYEEGISLAAFNDIAAMKLSAVTNRGTKKDFIDLYYLLKVYSLKQMLSFYEEKYNASTFIVLKSLTYFEDAEIEILPKMLDSTFDWTKLKNKIKKEVLKLS